MSITAAHLTGSFVPIMVVPITLAGVLYWARVRTLSWDGRPVPLWRQICFAGGLLTIAIALFSPVGKIADELVIAHMAEHLLLGDIATLLMVLGLTRSLLQPILAIRFFQRLEILAHPLVAFPLWAVNFYFWHVPVIYDAAYGTSAIHALEHITFVFFGCLVWMPLFGPLPKPQWFGAGWKVAYVFAVRFASAILGNVLMWSGTILYPIYATGEAHWHITAQTDQSTAGALMMVEGTFLAIGVLAWIFLDVAQQGIEKQRLLDLAFERGFELDERRAQRAVASGHAARLEERILAAGSGAEEVGSGVGAG